MANIELKNWAGSVSDFAILNGVGRLEITYDDVKAGLESGYVRKDDGTVGENKSEVHTDYLPIAGHTIWVYDTYETTTQSSAFVFYDADKRYISGVNYYVSGWCCAIVPANARYIRVSASATLTKLKNLKCVVYKDAQNMALNEDWQSGYLNSGGFYVTDKVWLYTINYIKVPVGATKVHLKTRSSGLGVSPSTVFYNLGQNMISAKAHGGATELRITVPTDTMYMRTSARLADLAYWLIEFE